MLIAVGSLVSTPAMAADGANKLVGAWDLDSMVQVRADGSSLKPTFIAGQTFTGSLIYSPDQWVSLQLVGLPGRQVARPADSKTYLPEEAIAILSGYYAYYGRYDYDPRRQSVRHRIVQSLRPHEVNQTNERKVSFTKGRLVLESPPTMIEGELRHYRLVWRRSRPL